MNRAEMNRHLDEIDGLGDWQGPLLDTYACVEGTPERHGQWLGRHSHREQWTHAAGILFRSADEDGSRRDAERAATYAAAALYAPASAWWVLEGEFHPWQHADEVDTETYAYLAGPFGAEDDALDALAAIDPAERLTLSVVPRRPEWTP